MLVCAHWGMGLQRPRAPQEPCGADSRPNQKTGREAEDTGTAGSGASLGLLGLGV